MKNRLMTFAGALALLAVLGKFYAPPLMAQVKATFIQDVDQAARQPFQVTVPVNINNFNFTAVTRRCGSSRKFSLASAVTRYSGNSA